jgi:2-dehydro-3-deoxyphosphogluconate aldolase / (4S)-4-hydroxy-2-oxoglutarate aldolase
MMDAIERLHKLAVIPVVELPEPALGVELARVLADAGLPAVEVTFRVAGAADAIAAIRAHVPDVLVAAGTVLTTDQAAAAVDAGAELIVSPGTNRRVVEFVLSRGGLPVPGVATPSEIEANLELGIRLMKLFPAELLGGVRYLQALAGPYREARFVPTGGVSRENLATYLGVQSVLACGGTWIAPRAALLSQDWAAIAAAAGEASAVAASVRAGAASG